MSKKWGARWISTGKTMLRMVKTTDPAPCLRKEFNCPEHWDSAILYLCGLGWHELYINGKKVDSRVLTPVISRYDQHVSYIKYDVTALLRSGANAIAVILGNSLYNAFEKDHWYFDTAPWRDYPKLSCKLEVDQQIILKSDNSWKFHDSPVIFNSMQNGEYYDARLTMDHFAEAGFDDSNWGNAFYCNPPGGIIEEETTDPCRVKKILQPVAVWQVDKNRRMYDFGCNITGWGNIKVNGPAGALVEMEYYEKIDPVSHLGENSEIAKYITNNRFQTDRYILRGNGRSEEWSPAFTYHGFRYIQLGCYYGAECEELQACFVHTDFEQAGNLETSDAMLNTLQENTVRSFLCNHTGLPTDCPHREKNGWTGDANWATETGIWNFNTRRANLHFLTVLTDCQRPNGQLPGIVPTGCYGYNWGNGPAWDSVLFEYAWQNYVYYADDTAIKRHYEAMKRYLDYCDSMSCDHLTDFGLGDWCLPDNMQPAPLEVTCSGYHHLNLCRMAFFARLLENYEDADSFEQQAALVRKAFVERYIYSDGKVADDSQTALATAVFCGLADAAQSQVIADRLAEKVRANAHKVDFGTIGAKFIPRVLGNYGYAEDVYKLFTQEEYPGWAWQVRQGATTLWEWWNGIGSRNHIMYGDISAWMYEYLAGVKPSAENPGFRQFEIKPALIPALNYVRMSHISPYGKISSSWQRQNNRVECTFELPEACSARVLLPGVDTTIYGGISKFTIS